MVNSFKIDPNSIYDDGALRYELGLSSATVKRARDEGRLRFTKQGHRILYLGSWVLAWLGAAAEPQKEVARVG